jgi:glutathione synthase/RimK-type ligase-like ATP-grasp enzyme
MSKVLFFTNSQHLLDDFRHRLANEQIESTVSSYSDLDFTLDGENSSIKLSSTGADLSDFDVIINISTPAHELIHIHSSLARYCRKKGVKILDDTFTNTSGKLYEMWRLWEKDVPVPKTAFGSISHLSRKLIDFGGVGVLKATHGSKGKENYLVHSPEEIEQILSDKNPYDYILQNFIPNTGDYRVVAFDYEPKLAIYRSATGTDHRNNTSLGAQANVVEITTELAQIAKASAEALDIKFAGVDIITDKNTGANYVLEINRTPQFASGSFLNEKYAVLRDYLRSLNI